MSEESAFLSGDAQFAIETLAIPGCLKLMPRIRKDHRGKFVKTVHRDSFSRLGLATEFVEQYYSYSKTGVLRGLHFQLPPEDHVKLVTCLHGKVYDVLLDLRNGSPTFGRHTAIELNCEEGSMLYIPRGIAHGFYCCCDSILLYHVTTAYSPLHDTGIRFDSAGIVWPDANPILSERDRQLPALRSFISPFVYGNL